MSAPQAILEAAGRLVELQAEELQRFDYPG
jgi:hypothetical protein